MSVHLDRQRRTVLALSGFRRLARPATGDERVVDGMELFDGRSAQVSRAHTEQLVAAVPEHLAGGGVHFDEAHRVPADQDDPVGGRVHGRPEAQEVRRPGLHLRFEDGGVVLEKVSERFQSQQVADPK